MPDGASYDTDFFLWTRDQADRLRSAAKSRSNADVDWEHVAEEIESLGKSDRPEVRSRLETILDHLLKLRFSPASQPRQGWTETVIRERKRIRAIIDDSPSLRKSVPEMIAAISTEVRAETAALLATYGETEAANRVKAGEGPEVEERVLDVDFIPHPPGDAT